MNRCRQWWHGCPSNRHDLIREGEMQMYHFGLRFPLIVRTNIGLNIYMYSDAHSNPKPSPHLIAVSTFPFFVVSLLLMWSCDSRNGTWASSIIYIVFQNDGKMYIKLSVIYRQFPRKSIRLHWIQCKEMHWLYIVGEFGAAQCATLTQHSVYFSNDCIKVIKKASPRKTGVFFLLFPAFDMNYKHQWLAENGSN